MVLVEKGAENKLLHMALSGSKNELGAPKVGVVPLSNLKGRCCLYVPFLGAS